MDIYSFLVYALCFIGLFLVSFYSLGMLKHYKKTIRGPRTDLKVSIIIPAYNEEKSIERTMRSVAALEYPANNLEIIVVDDGSKDNTYSIAKRVAGEIRKKGNSPKIIVITKTNGGKGSALNLGISKSQSEIVVTMDADTFTRPDSLKKMMGYFYSPDVMSVTPTIGIHEPKSIWQRIQHVEYYVSTYLRKSFAIINAIHITPGAFAAYRREFFNKYGGFDVGNITEDIEVALRVQYNHFIIENTPSAVVYTIAPRTFRQFLTQRKRWYTGYVHNLWKYKKLFSKEYGAMGMIVLPAALTTLVMALVLTVYSLIKSISQIRDGLVLLQSTGFEFGGWMEINQFVLMQFLYKFFSQPIFIFTAMFIFFLCMYLVFSRKTMKYNEGVMINLVLFLALYSLVYTTFWLISLMYVAIGRKAKWR